jgi:hypothetical protein
MLRAAVLHPFLWGIQRFTILAQGNTINRSIALVACYVAP